MTRKLYLYGCLLVAACGGGADPGGGGAGGNSGGSIPVAAGPRVETSGARLKKIWLAANDNSVIPAGYYDATLKTRCSFQQVSYGVELCVPEDVYTLTADDWGNLYSTSNRALFTDSSCKTAGVAALNSEQCAKYGVVRVLPDTDRPYVPACGGANPPKWFVATPLPAGTQLYYYGVPAGGGQCCSCQPLKQSAGEDYLTYVKMEPLSSTNLDQVQLVRGQLSVDP